MQLGVGLPSFASESHAIPPDRFRRYARLADEAGFAGAWVIEHLVQPPTYATSMADPLVTLSVVAGETETIPVGTSVLLLPLRNPVMVAKRAATLQHLTSRRLTLGLGTGYVDAEFDAVGVPKDERSRRFREGISLLRSLFTGDTVTFDGEFYSVDEFRLEPQLGQPPRILTGGGGVDTPDGRVVRDSVTERLRLADGWIASSRSLDVLEEDWAAFAESLEADGRDPDALDRVALQYLHLVPGGDDDRIRRAQRSAYGELVGPARSADFSMEHWLSGTIEEVTASLRAYERHGFDEVILYPVSRNPGDLDRQLRLFRDRLLPEFP